MFFSNAHIIPVRNARKISTNIPVVLALFLPMHSIFAQEFLSSPSFEYGEPQCDFTIGKNGFNTHVGGWTLPTNGTTDIFSTVLVNKYCWTSMPPMQEPPQYSYFPQIGNQMPRSGSRFIGLFTLSKNITQYSEPGDTTYREYAQAQMLSPLVQGETYCAGMFVSRAEGPRYAANNLGMLFHENEINQRYYIPATPQIIEKEVIVDTNNWVKIEGAFRAKTAARFVTIGNFFSYAETSVIDVGGTRPGTELYEYAYYFVDDVYIRKLEPKTFVFSGATAICEGDVANIKIEGGLENIVWTTLSDTVTVLGKGENFSLRPLATTSYLLKGKNCGLDVKDTLTINVKPGHAPELGGDQIICAGTSLTLDAGVGYKNYKWQDGSTDRFFHAKETGSYTILVENENGCNYSDNIQITVEDVPTVNIGNDTLLCSNFFTLQPGLRPNTTYRWSTGSTSHEITPTEPGTYSVTLKNSCGEASDTITIYSIENLFMTNVVTMNDDNLNEKFVVQGKIRGGDLTIYNRWGTQVLQTNDYQNNWPHENTDISSGTYYYRLKYQGCKAFSGWLEVIKN